MVDFIFVLAIIIFISLFIYYYIFFIFCLPFFFSILGMFLMLTLSSYRQVLLSGKETTTILGQYQIAPQ